MEQNLLEVVAHTNAELAIFFHWQIVENFETSAVCLGRLLQLLDDLFIAVSVTLQLSLDMHFHPEEVKHVDLTHSASLCRYQYAPVFLIRLVKLVLLICVYFVDDWLPDFLAEGAA